MTLPEQTAVTEHVPPERPIDSATALINMIERVARDPSIDIARLEKLIEMRTAFERERARSAFTRDLAQLQGRLPAILKRGAIDIGRGGKKQPYAKLEHIIAELRKPLHRYGFSFSFHTEHPSDGKLAVTTILRHRDGYEDRTTIVLPYDVSGSKNAVQSIGSSTTYGRRYGIMSMLNLATENEDDDGSFLTTGGVIGGVQLGELRLKLAEAKADEAKFLAYFRIDSLAALPTTRFDEAIQMLEQKKEKANASAGK